MYKTNLIFSTCFGFDLGQINLENADISSNKQNYDVSIKLFISLFPRYQNKNSFDLKQNFVTKMGKLITRKQA